MANYYIINKTTRVPIRESNTPFNIDETVQPPLPAFQLKRVDDHTIPAYNAATHRIVRSFVDNDTAATRTFFNEAVPMTAAEITAYNQKQTDATTLAQIKATALDIRNGTGTATERIVRLEKAVFHILKYLFGNGS